MANIDKNIDNNEIGEKNNKSSIKNAKEKVKKLVKFENVASLKFLIKSLEKIEEGEEESGQ